MINPTGKKLEKLLFGIFDEAIQGVDTYNHNGSMWLIFTDDMKWVVEYTKSQTLWYNYYFFKNEMEIIGLDCVENKDLIQKWFESRFLNKNEVKETDKSNSNYRLCVEDTIQNGVKNTGQIQRILQREVEDIIQNGVKETNDTKFAAFEDAIQNGIKETKGLGPSEVTEKEINNTIQNGVKEIKEIGDFSLSSAIFNINCKKTIRDGVKHTKALSRLYANPVEDTIQNGVKNTDYCIHHTNGFVEDTIQNGVKNIFYEYSQKPKIVEETIQNGVEQTCEWRLDLSHKVKDTIRNGVKKIRWNGELGTHLCEDVIENGKNYLNHKSIDL